MTSNGRDNKQEAKRHEPRRKQLTTTTTLPGRGAPNHLQNCARRARNNTRTNNDQQRRRKTQQQHCLGGQTRAIPVQIHCQYAGGAGAACPWPPARPNPPESTHITPFAIYHHQHHTFCHITPFCFLITPFFWYVIRNLRYLAENPRYRTGRTAK